MSDGPVDRQGLSLGEFRERVDARLRIWEEQQFGARLWHKDPTLWSPEPVPEIVDRLGWLDLPTAMAAAVEELTAFAQEIRAAGITRVVLLGMGGSSLAPEVFQRTFGPSPGFPDLTVLDSTHPDAVRALSDAIEVDKTLFVVSSKSGTTLETLSLFRFFWAQAESLGAARGGHFAAVTDSGTPLEALARERGFAKVFSATADVGGRYSALTHFGLLPAALLGTDVSAILASARAAAASCGPEVLVRDNPALALGAALGELALAGRDKATLVASPSLAALPIWLEQLIAESTGKAGRGIVPIADEALGSVSDYRADRFFVHLRLAGEPEAENAARLAELEKAGHPVARVDVADKEDLGGIFFLWEAAVAAAGAVLGIHPFNQPDVQLAKELAKKAMAAKNAAHASSAVSADRKDELASALASWMDSARGGDYVAIQAYLAPDAERWEGLQSLRLALRKRMGSATTVGYGPRFLHSTGQLHKGGPNTGLFLQITDEPAARVPVPETDFTFNELIRAQAAGDGLAMRQRNRRVLSVNLGENAGERLSRLIEALAP
jgi:transaldolase/glucose-6-phosphate isomerase